jgi:hypothetical protein
VKVKVKKKAARIFILVLFVLISAIGLFLARGGGRVFQRFRKPQKIEVSAIRKGGGQMPEEFSCRPAIVEWLDAVIRSRAGGELEKALEDNTPLLIPAVSVGCVIERDLKEVKEVIVIFGFSDGKPEDFITIPGPWIKKITYLSKKGVCSKPKCVK